MLKKITVMLAALVMCLGFAGCSDKEYVMTEADLALQKSMVGYWTADDSSGANTYDEDGNITHMIMVQFTEDYKYLLHDCDIRNGYVTSYSPVAYTIEDEKFKVMNGDKASYAKIKVSSEGDKLYWITDDATTIYLSTPEQAAKNLGVPEYNSADWGGTAVTEDTSAETEASGEQVVSPGGYVLDPSMKFVSDGDFAVDYVNNAVVIARPESSDIVIYGIYDGGNKPIVFIEHGGVIDEFEQDWLTPHNVLPLTDYCDIDNDGEKELICSYHTGSGTGISVHELVVYKTGDDGHFVEHRFDAAEKLGSMVNYVIDNDNSWLDFAAYGTDEIYSTSTANDYPDGIESIGFGDNISYDFNSVKIKLYATPSTYPYGYGCMPNIVADVVFDGEDFDLENIIFMDNE